MQYYACSICASKGRAGGERDRESVCTCFNECIQILAKKTSSPFSDFEVWWVCVRGISSALPPFFLTPFWVPAPCLLLP